MDALRNLGNVNFPGKSSLVDTGKAFCTRSAQLFGKTPGVIPQGQEEKYAKGLTKMRVGVALAISGALTAAVGVAVGAPLIAVHGAGVPIVLGGVLLGFAMITGGVALAAVGMKQMDNAQKAAPAPSPKRSTPPLSEELESPAPSTSVDSVSSNRSGTVVPAPSANNKADKMRGILAKLQPEDLDILHELDRIDEQSPEELEEELTQKFGQELYNGLEKNKDFIRGIWKNEYYTPAERELLVNTAREVYVDDGKVASPEGWVNAETSRDYLDDLAVRHRNFSPIPGRKEQYEDNTLADDIPAISAALPQNISEAGPRIYGHTLRQGGNHRTAFIVDLDRRTVEFFNSFGNDIGIRQPLTALAAGLSKKYGENFTYKHPTAGQYVQNDTYQCGIWSCKLLEERVEKGKKNEPFDVKALKGFDIADFRTRVFAKALITSFFYKVGNLRFSDYLTTLQVTQGVDPNQLKREIAKIIKERDPYANPVATLHESLRQWGTHGMPASLEELIEEAKRRQTPA